MDAQADNQLQRMLGWLTAQIPVDHSYGEEQTVSYSGLELDNLCRQEDPDGEVLRYLDFCELLMVVSEAQYSTYTKYSALQRLCLLLRRAVLCCA